MGISLGVQEAVLEYRPLIRDMPADERPRERLRMRGPEALTNAELIAILLRTGADRRERRQRRAPTDRAL